MIETRQKTIQVGIRQRSLRKHCRLGRATELVFILATGVTLALSGGAEAQTWDGETSADWTVGANWNPDGAPAAVDTATIAGNGANAPEVLVDTSVTVEEVEVTDGTLTVRGELVANSFVNVSGTGVVRVEPGVGSNGILSSLVDIEAGGTLSVAGLIDGTVRVNAGTLELDGGIIDDGTPTHTVAIQQGGIVRAISDSTLDGALIDVIANETGTITAADGVTLTIATSDIARRIDSTTTFGTAGVAGTVVIAPTSSITIGNNSVVNVAGGTLRVGSAFAGGTYLSSGLNVSTSVDSGATIDVNGFNTTIQRLSGAGTITNDGAAAATVTLNNPTGGNTDFSGVIENGTSAVAVTKSGAGTMTLLGTNTYTGITTVSAGTLQIGNGGTTGALGTGNITNNAALVFNRSDAITVGNVISGSGTVTQAGTGNTTLSGTNTYEGATNVNAGTLTISNGAALGTTAAGTTVADGATLAVTGGITTAEAITLNGTGVGDGGALVNVSGNNTLSGQITLGSATLITSSDTDFADQLNISGGITGTDTNLTLGGAGSFNITGAITTGSGTLTKDGTGIAFLQGANDFTGATTINGGSITVSSGTALSDTALVTINAPGLLAVQTSETVGNIAGDGQINLFAAATLTAGDATPTSTFSGTIIDNNPGDAGNFTKQGTGTLILSGTNTYTGTTTISAGTLQVGDGGTTGTLGTGGVTNNAALVFDRSDATTVANVISGTGALTQTGSGTLTLSGNNSYGGLTTVDAGSTLRITNDAALGATGVGAGTTVADGAALELSDGITVAEAITLNGTGVANGGALRSVSGNNTVGGAITLGSDARINTDAGQLDITGGITGAFDLTIGGAATTFITSNIATGTGTLTKEGGGVLTLSVANGFTGATTVNGGSLQVTATGAGALSATGLLTVNAPGFVQLFANETVGNITGDGGIFLESAGLTLTAGDTTDQTFSGGIGQNGANAANFTKQGTGTLILSGASTYTGTTTVSGGVLNVTGSVASASNVVNDTGTLRVDGASLADTSTVTLNGNGIFDVTGPETIGTLVSASAASSVTLGANTLTVNGDGDVATTESATFAGVISGTGGLTKSGTDILVLSGTNTFTGTTSVTGGELHLNGGTALVDTNAVNVTGGRLEVNGAETIGTLAGAAPGVVDLNDNTLTIGGNATAGVQSTTFGGEITGTGGLTKSGIDTQVLSGTNTYTGATTINGGVLEVTSGSAIADTGSVIVGNGGTFTVNTNQEFIGNLSSSDIATSTAVVNNNSGLVITGSGDTTFDGNIAGAAQLTYQGTGSLTLTGANALTGNLVSSGLGGGNDGTDDGAINITGDGAVASQFVLALDGGTITTDGGALVSNANLIVDGVNSRATLTGSETIGALLGNGPGVATTGTVTLTGAGTILTLNGTSAFDSFIGGSVTGTGTLNVTGGSTTVASGGSVTTAALTVAGGTVNLNGTGSVDTTGNAITVSSGALVNDGDGIADTDGVTVSGTGTLTTNGTDTIAALTQTGGTVDGTALLTAGTFTQSGGDMAGLVAATTSAALNGGTISGTLSGGPATAASGITTVTGSVTSSTLTVSGGTVNLNGAGNVDTSGNSITVSAGALVNDGDGIANNDAVTVSGTGTLTTNGTDTIAALTQTGGTVNGTALLTAGTYTQSGGDMAGLVATTTSATLNGGTISGTLSGAAATVQGATATTLTGTIGANTTITGTLNVDGGTVTGATTMNGGTLAGLSSSTITGAVSTGAAGGTITAATGSTLTLSQLDLSSSSLLTIGATGQTGTVQANSSFSANSGASLAIEAGTLRIGGANAGGFMLDAISGTSVASGTTLDMGGFATNLNALSGAGTVTNTGAAAGLTLTGASTFGGVIQNGTGAVGLTVTGNSILGANANVTLTGNNTFSGGTTVQGLGGLTASLTLQGAGSNLSSTGLVTVNTGGTLVIDGNETIGNLNGTGSGTVNITSGTLTLDDASGSYTGAITGAGDLVKNGTGTLAIGGNISNNTVTVNAGTLTLSGTNTMTQITVAGAAATLRLESNEAAGGAGGLIRTTGSVIDFADGVTIATPVEIASNTTQAQVTTGTATQSGAIGQDVALRPLEKIGAGTLILSGINTFTGDLTITGGTLAVANGAAIEDTVEVVVGTGATFRLDAGETIGALSSAAADATLATGANFLDIAGAQDTAFAGIFTGTGAIRAGGSGDIEFTGDGSGFTGVLAAIGTGAEVSLTGTGRTNATVVGAATGAAFSTDGGAILATNAILIADGQVTLTGSETVGVLRSSGIAVAGGTVTLTGAGTVLTVNGSANALNPTNLNGTTGTINGTGSLNITGGSFAVGGTGNVQTATTIVGPGAVVNSGTMAGVTNAGTFTNNTGATAGAVANTGTATIEGTIASLTNTAGTTTVQGGGIVTGNTSVSGGAIVLAASNLNDASTVAVSGTGTLTVNGTDTVGVLNQTGGTVDGSSTLTVAGAFTQDGGATDGTVIVNAGSFTQDGGTIGSGTTVSVDGPGTKTLNGGTINGTLTGSGLVTVQTGTTLLNGTISDGEATIAATGVLELTGDSLVTSLDFEGGELTASADATLTGSFMGVLDANQNGTISAANTVTLTLASNFFVRGLAAEGTTTTFGSAGNDGTVVIATNGAGNLGNNAAVVIAGGTVVVGSAPAAAAAFDNDAGAVIGVTTTVDATLDINGFNTNVANLGGNGDIVNNGGAATLILQTDQASTFDGVIGGGTGVISVRKDQGGTQILTADQAYTGTTTVNAGVLQAGNGGTAGTFGAGDIIVNAPGTATLNRSDDITVANLITGNGTLVHAGTGTTTLTASNTAGSQFTGTANINAGTVQLNGLLGDSVGNAATMNVNSGGTLQGTGTFAGDVNVFAGGILAAGTSPGTLNIGGDLVLAGTTIFELGTADVFGGNGPTNDMINVGGNLTLGGTLSILDNGTFGTGYYRLFNYTGDPAGTPVGGSFATVNNPLGGTTATVLTNVAGQVNLRMSDGSTPVQFWDGTDVIGNGSIDGNTGIWDATTPSWTNANGSFNDGWLSGDGVFQGTAGTVTVNGAQSFQTLTFDVAGYTLTGGGSLLSPTAGGFSIIETNGDTAINVQIAGPGGINKTGTAVLSLGAVNTYAGTTDVAEGTLRLTVDAALPTTTVVTVFNNATLDVNGTTQTIAALNGPGSNSVVALGADGDLTVDGTATTIFAGVVSGGDASVLTQQGSGTLTFLGNSTMTGTMTTLGTTTMTMEPGATTRAQIVGAGESGTFVTNGGALASNAVLATGAATSIVTLLGTESVGFLANTDASGAGLGTINLTGAATRLVLTGTANTLNAGNISQHSGRIEGDGALTVVGGTHRLSSVAGNTYLGTTTVAAGSLELAGGLAIRDLGVVDLQATGNLRVVNNETIGQLAGTGNTTLVLNSILTTGGTNASTTMSGTVSGAGGLTKVGTGTFTLSGSNTYDGLTRVDAGVLEITNAGSLGSTVGGTIVASGATLQLTGPGGIAPEALTINGAGVGSGGALRNLSGVNSWSGNITLGSASQITTVADSLTVEGTITNGGNLLTVNGAGNTTLSGVISGAGGLTKNDASTLTLGGANTYAGATTINDGTVTITAGGGMLNTASVAVNGDSVLTNAGTINTAATTSIAASASFANSGTAGTVSNSGAFANTGTAGTVTNNGTFTNSGTAGAVDNNSTFTNSGTVASLDNSATFTSNAGTVTGLAANNGGTMTVNSGNFAGGLNNTAGTLSANGAMSGNVSNAATFNVTGALTGGAGTLANTGTLNVNANYTGLGTATNSGTVNLAGTQLGTAGLTNAGAVNVTGTATLAGGVSGAGSINLGANDGVANTLNLTGPAGSVGANNFSLGYTAGGAGDRIVSDGGAVFSGALQAFNITLQDNFALGTSALVVEGQGGLTSNLTIQNTLGENLNTGGALLYSLTDVAGNTRLAVEANPAVGGIASGVSLTQSLVANVVNRPSSPFASGLASEIGCSQGGYGRAVGGRAEAKGSSFSGVVNRENSLTAKYFGVQAGYDFICNDGRFFDGWNGGAGVLLGYNKGSTDQPVLLDLGGGVLTQTSTTRSDFDQKYAGFYVVGNKDRLTVDGQIRFEDTEYKLNESPVLGFDGLGLNNSTFSTRGTNFTGRVSYNIPINDEGLNFVPTAGISITRTGSAVLDFTGVGAGNRLTLDAYTSKVGFIGGTLARTTINEEAASGSTLFVSGNYYHEFGGDRTATFATATSSTPITSDNLGGFGELSFGWNYIKVLDAGSAGARQVNTNLRLDTRFGSNISNSYSLTAQVRLSF